MKWSNIPKRPIPGTVKSNTKSERMIARRNAKPKKVKSSQLYDTDKVLDLIQSKITNAEFMPIRDDGQITFKKRREIVLGYRILLMRLNATHFLTFMPGRKVEPETIASNIVKFCCRLERKALGKKWSKCKKERIRLIGFLEHPDTNPHYHAFVYVPTVTLPFLKKHAAKIWTKLMPAGKFDALPIYDEKWILSYTLKDLHHHWSPENAVIYKPIKHKR